MDSANSSTVFFNRFGRLRSGWRFFIFLSAFVFFSFLLGGIVQLLLRQIPADTGASSLLFLFVNGSISLFLAVVLGWLCGKYLEGLPFRALGCAFTRGWLKHLIVGLIFGALTLIAGVLVAVTGGGLSFQMNREHGWSAIFLTLGISLAVFTVAAAFEEALFRGYMLQTFARAQLAWLAIILTSLFFAAVHIGNPGAGAISTINTAIAGVWFGVAYMKTRDLWFPFGLHLMWNWMLGAFFGIEVSGLKEVTTAPLFQEIDTGPVWLTGEQYGIEGGIACTVALVLSTAAIWFVPFLKPSEEMLALTGKEQPQTQNNLPEQA